MGENMRRFQFSLLAAAAAAVGFASIASAADLPVKALPYVAAPSWTGFYVGAGVGARWMDSDWTTTSTFFPNGVMIPFFLTDPNATFSSAALRISGYAGYNWQVAPISAGQITMTNWDHESQVLAC